MNLLKDKVCIITGCNRGIGAAILQRFAEEGAIVYATARAGNCIDDICEGLARENNTEVTPLYFDVTDEQAMKQAFMRVKKERQSLDVVVNNAGIMQDALIGMCTKKMMQDTFETNVFAVMNSIQYAKRIMLKQKSGSIINLSSIVGENGNPGQLVYSASKGAVSAMTKTAAKELAEYNIRVNAIAPGMIDTELFHSIGEMRVEESLMRIRMGRLGEPQEVADVCVFLASDLSRYVTGEIIGVNGAEMI